MAFLWGAEKLQTKNAPFWCSNSKKIRGESLEQCFSSSPMHPSDLGIFIQLA